MKVSAKGEHNGLIYVYQVGNVDFGVAGPCKC